MISAAASVFVRRGLSRSFASAATAALQRGGQVSSKQSPVAAYAAISKRNGSSASYVSHALSVQVISHLDDLESLYIKLKFISAWILFVLNRSRIFALYFTYFLVFSFRIKYLLFLSLAS